MKTHSDFIYRTLPQKQAELEIAQAPLLVGEWNPVFENLGGGDLMRRYFDEYGKRGWAATIWSYKILHREGGVIDDNWYMVSNTEPLKGPDFATASIDQIEAYFKWFGTMKYVVDEPMREALTRVEPVALPIPEPAPLVTTPPHSDGLVGWNADDIGGALSGGQQVLGDDAMTIYGGGDDIWAGTDQFRLVWKEVEGDFVITATLESLGDTHVFAKAGLMARADLSPGSVHVLVHVFPTGKLSFGWREAAQKPMAEVGVESDTWPVHLRLTRRGNTFVGEYSHDGIAWHQAGEGIELESIGDRCHIGMAVLSHVTEGLTEARFRDIQLNQAQDAAP